MGYREGAQDVFRSILEARRRNPFCSIAAMTGFANIREAATITDMLATDYRLSTVDPGTGDDADTPAMRERAALRNRKVSAEDVFKMIDKGFAKPVYDRELLSFVAVVLDSEKDRELARAHGSGFLR